MCKKLFLLFLTLTISLSFSSCSNGFSDSDMDIYEKIHKYYNKMESFSAELDMSVFSNKTENRYFVSQKFKSPDKFYMRLTDKDGLFSVLTVTNGAVTKVLADGSDYALTVPSDDYLNMLFVNNFFRAYYASEQTSCRVNESFSNSNKTVLEVFPEDEALSIKSVSLSIDNETLLPDTMIFYGDDNKVLSKTKFINFKYNEKTEDSIFNTD